MKSTRTRIKNDLLAQLKNANLTPNEAIAQSISSGKTQQTADMALEIGQVKTGVADCKSAINQLRTELKPLLDWADRQGGNF